MELIEIAEQTFKVYKALDKGWVGYDAEITLDDVHVAIAAMVDYLDGVDGPVKFELPSAGLTIVRDHDGSHRLLFEIGEIDIAPSDSE